MYVSLLEPLLEAYRRTAVLNCVVLYFLCCAELCCAVPARLSNVARIWPVAEILRPFLVPPMRVVIFVLRQQRNS